MKFLLTLEIRKNIRIWYNLAIRIAEIVAAKYEEIEIKNFVEIG